MIDVKPNHNKFAFQQYCVETAIKFAFGIMLKVPFKAETCACVTLYTLTGLHHKLQLDIFLDHTMLRESYVYCTVHHCDS